MLENCDKSAEEIDNFNHAMVNRGPNETTRERFEARRQEVDPTRTDITTWVALQDLDDELSFGIVDLNRRPPRSPSNTDVYGTVQLARLIDKGRAYIGNTLGGYFYGEDSRIDRITLEFLGVSHADFTEALKTLQTDADVETWLKANHPKSDADIKAFNDKMLQLGPETEQQKARMAERLKKIDADPSKITTLFAAIELDDEKTFAL